MLRRGTKPAAFYRGNGLPAQLYRGTQLIAGYHDYTQQAMGEWEWSYNDHLAVAATGKGKQDGTPTPSAPVPLISSQGTLTSSDRGGTRTSSAALPILRELWGRDIRDTAEYIGGGQWKVTRNIGVIELTGAESWYVGGGQSFQAGQRVKASGTSGRCDSYNWIYDRNGAGMYVVDTIVVLGAAAAAAYDSLAAWKAYLAERYAANNPVTLWVRLAVPIEETLTLGELATYPGYTSLTVSGDYVPDITATAKVAD